MAERSRPDINYTFSPAELEALKAYGEVRRHEVGDVLVEEGAQRSGVYVTLSGEIHIYVQEATGSRRVGWMETGQFGGDITALTGHAALGRHVMGVAGEVLHIPHERLQRLLVDDSHLSDIFVRTFTARRAFALEENFSVIIVIGAAGDRDVFALRNLLSRHSVPHQWFDPEDDLAKSILDAKGLNDGDLPVAVLGGERTLKRPTVNQLAEFLGFDLVPDGETADVVIIGAGPGGLAASVYAASEGLSVVTLDEDSPGGQAGSSSKIENYLGFPMGLSGRELADRAAVQAQKFGVRLATPACATRIEPLEDGLYCVRLMDGRSLKARAIVIATGAQYRRLPIEGVERFEGRGVYYGASPLEAQMCEGQDVAIVGAGNSAGQAAMFLSRTAACVHVLYRRADIRETMSDYLVRRLEESPRVHLHPEAEIIALHAAPNGREPHCLKGVTVRRPGGDSFLETPHVFLFIGAAPRTSWLPDTLSRDKNGFIITGREIRNIDLVRAGWRLDRMPTTYETSWPRIYAIGDVRHGSVKRVASSVGEGSVVVSAVHAALTEFRAGAPGARSAPSAAPL